MCHNLLFDHYNYSVDIAILIFHLQDINFCLQNMNVFRNISGMDRLSRLADHVLSQSCFYPVYPPFEDLNVDTELWGKYAFFEQQPHLLILPSDMRSYCKVINECVTLNPERMHKHAYAKLSVKPVVDGKWRSDNISCEIAKV